MKRRRNFPVIALAVPLVGSFAATALGQPSKQELVDRLLEATPDDFVANPWAADINGFRLESARVRERGADLAPTGHVFDSLTAAGTDTFRVGIEKGRGNGSLGGGITLYHRESGQPMLSAADRTGDGRIDILTYTVVDADGAPVREMIDYEADGQWDMRMELQQGYFEIWHADRWYRTESRDGRRGIVIDSDFVELERSDNRWIVRDAVRGIRRRR